MTRHLTADEREIVRKWTVSNLLARAALVAMKKEREA